VVRPGDPVTPTLPPDGAEQSRRGARQVDITGYRVQGRLLRVFYTVDQTGNCSTSISEPEVRETANSVVVRLERRGSRAPDEVCTNLMLGNSVDIPLSRPMGGRVLQDGSRGGSLVPPSRS
jgi:hypothetical protein